MAHPSDFVVELVNKIDAEIPAVVVLQGSVAIGSLVASWRYFDWLHEQVRGALAEQGWDARQRSDAEKEVNEEAERVEEVRGSVSTAEFALKDVTLRDGQAVYHMPFLLVSAAQVGAITLGKPRIG
jgi:hypothetical protein